MNEAKTGRTRRQPKTTPVTQWHIAVEVTNTTADVYTMADTEAEALIQAVRNARDNGNLGSICRLTVVARRVAGGPWIGWHKWTTDGSGLAKAVTK